MGYLINLWQNKSSKLVILWHRVQYVTQSDGKCHFLTVSSSTISRSEHTVHTFIMHNVRQFKYQFFFYVSPSCSVRIIDFLITNRLAVLRWPQCGLCINSPTMSLSVSGSCLKSFLKSSLRCLYVGLSTCSDRQGSQKHHSSIHPS